MAPLLLAREDALLWATLPADGAGLSADAIAGLTRALRDAPREGVRAIVLASPSETGFAGGTATGPALAPLLVRLTRCEVPVVASLSGVVAGDGLALAFAADVRIASDDAVLDGGGPTAPGTFALLARLCGRAGASLVAFGGAIDARRAERAGLVHRVVEPRRLREATGGFAADLARLDAAELAARKRALVAAGELPLAEAVNFECWAAPWRGARRS